jgi:hypothetical protein
MERSAIREQCSGPANRSRIFMVFGYFRRSRLTSEALAVVRPLMETVAVRGPIPVEALLDPYVLGFIQMTVVFHVARANKGNLNDLGSVLIAVHEEIAGSNSRIVSEAAIEYAGRKDMEFMRGQGDADRVCCLLYGIEVLPTGSFAATNPDPAAAQQILQSSFIGHINRKYRKTL